MKDKVEGLYNEINDVEPMIVEMRLVSRLLVINNQYEFALI